MSCSHQCNQGRTCDCTSKISEQTPENATWFEAIVIFAGWAAVIFCAVVSTAGTIGWLYGTFFLQLKEKL